MKDLRICLDVEEALPVLVKGRQVIEDAKLWGKPEARDPKNPSAQPIWLEAGFLDDPHGLRPHVEAAAREWEQCANVRFAFDTPLERCKIRISFLQPGAWSFVGTACATRPQEEPTTNFGILKADTPEKEIRRVMLHELGHVLGCGHEHFHPDGPIHWNDVEVYKYYQERYGWPKARVQAQVLRRYAQNLVSYSEFDSKSIMLYATLPELTLDGWHSEVNWELSEMDKQFIATKYPRPKPA
jgi:hypothetical protein